MAMNLESVQLLNALADCNPFLRGRVIFRGGVVLIEAIGLDTRHTSICCLHRSHERSCALLLKVQELNLHARGASLTCEGM